MRVGIIDYGTGNLGSILRALTELRVAPVLLSRATDMRTADCVILPGVGNFFDCVRLLDAGGWITAIRQEVESYGRPLLGICLGMQLLADSSTEGAPDGKYVSGLGLIPGKVRHLHSLGCTQRVPHVGWNSILRTRSDDLLFQSIPDNTDFYFVHSYVFSPEDTDDVLAITDYGVPITAAVRRRHVWGTQFHPEKSSRAGLRLLTNFIENAKC